MAETLKKIQELIEQNKILERRNDELKNIIDINLSKQSNEPPIPISDVIGKSEIESLVFKFYQTHKIPAALFNNKPEILFSIGWKKLFTSNTMLNKNIAFISKILDNLNDNTNLQKYYHHTCKFGFNSLSFPIEIKQEHQATLVFNQFFYKDEIPGYESICQFAKEYNISESVILAQLSEFPVYTHNEMDNFISQAIVLSEMISFVGTKNYEFYKRFKQQTDKEVLLNFLLKKITEQEGIIKNLLRCVTEHQKDINENTVRKSYLKKETGKLTRKLERTETILNSILTSSPLGICLLKMEVITFTNDQMFKLTGYTTKELLGRPLEFILPDSTLWRKMVSSVESGVYNEHISFTTTIKRKDGKKNEVTVFFTQVQPGKQSEGYTLSILDNSFFKDSNYGIKQTTQTNTGHEEKFNHDWSNKTILIAEDEELNFIYLKKMLSPTNVRMIWAQNGQQAIDLFNENLGINLILMDIKMPVLNGIEATRIIKSLKKQIPIIAQTAYVQESTKDEIFKAGCDEFLAKPIMTSYFIKVLEKYLET